MTRKEQLAQFERLLDVLDELRVKCPWDRKQTNESLRPNTIEETYELCDALIKGDQPNICKELGDVLLHVLFYAKIGSEGGHFDIGDVCQKLTDKLIFRHPHVFGEEAAANAEEVSKLWEQIKQKEKDGNKTVLAGVPSSLPSLVKAYRIQDKARNVGFDWEERSQVWAKVKEEISEFEAEVESMDKEKATEEFGDVLFSLINAARLYHINPDNALERTNQKFIRRFTYLEERTLKQGRNLKDMTLTEMDAIWDEAKQQERGLRIEKNFSLKHHNTFGLDVSCQQFIEYHSVEQLREALALVLGADNRQQTEGAQAEAKWMQIGGGSNLLFTTDYNGTILKSAIRGKEILNSSIVRAGAAEPWDDFVAWTLSKGFYGLECLSLIPGEVGASAVQNIGAYGSEAGQYIEAVHAIEVATGQPRTFTREECQYGYRSSIFKHELAGQYIITHVDFRLSRKFCPTYSHRAIPEGLTTAEEVRQAVIAIRQSKLPDPAELGSAGSFFMNPVVSGEQAEALKAEHPDMPQYPVADGVKLPAGWLIEQAGWKGKGIKSHEEGTAPNDKEQARVHDKQALVIVNHGSARPKDIIKLATAIQEDVLQKFGVSLQPEAIYVGGEIRKSELRIKK